MAKIKRLGKAHRHNDQMPLFTPNCDWVAPDPTNWPDFRDCKYLGVDTETHDPELEKYGPGFIAAKANAGDPNKSELVGVSLADENGRKLYLPIGHAEGNVDKGKALEYVQYQVKRPDLIKVGANIMYDMESLWSEGVTVHGDYRDVQVAEPLLNEDRQGGYSLEALAQSYLGLGKTEGLMREAAAAYGGDGANAKKMAKIMPAKYWGLYAEDDADIAVQIYLLQLKELQAEELLPIFQLETDLTPVLFAMRLHGVAVDLDEAERVRDTALREEQRLIEWLHKAAQWEFNPSSSADIAKVLDELGHAYPLNKPTKAHPNGAPSITNELLQELGDVDVDTKQPSGAGDQFCANLYEFRRINKMRKDFVEGAILNRNIRGRIHPQWHQLREFDEEGNRTRGTRSGRIAASRPNLTQVPARDPVWGKRVRGLFVADRGKRWAKFDYSQQEPRFLVHFTYLMSQLPRHLGGRPMPGAADAVKRWCADPTIDYHQMTSDLILARTGKKILRRPAKDINLGGAYGMGFAKLCRKLKVDDETGKGIMQAYHEGVPYVRGMSESCMERVSERGFIRTILGRKRRFPYWEKKTWGQKDPKYSILFKSFEAAVEACGGPAEVVRAGIHKALNGLVQGSAGDQMKKTLVLLHAEGLTPQIQVYDELDGSWESDDQIRRIRDIMEHSIPLVVPHLVESEVGVSWGNLVDWKDAA